MSPAPSEFKPSEFEMIQQYFSNIIFPNSAVVLGVGDDAAIIRVPDKSDLVFSIDTQHAGVHFPFNDDVKVDLEQVSKIAQRALRCAMSDLAAMGAEPLCFTLALSLSSSDAEWLDYFSQGLKQAATEFQCSLLGGDTTKINQGGLSITLQVQGLCPSQQALTRSQAQPGDLVFVSGNLGGAAAYIASLGGGNDSKLSSHAEELFAADFFYPMSRIELGQALRQRASSAIDISDGLLADLQHVCDASGVSAELQIDEIPCRPELQDVFGRQQALQLALNGGDDYELCFTVPEEKRKEIVKLAEDMECPVTEIGCITNKKQESTITCYQQDNSVFSLNDITMGYQHF